MAAVDAQWPTEDEDFDAVSDQKKKNARTTVEIQEESTTEPSVEDTITPEAVPEPAANDAAASSAAPVEAASAPEVTSEPAQSSQEAPVETSGDSPQQPADVSPAAPTEPPKEHAMTAVGRLVFEAILVLLVVGLGLWAWTLSSDRNNLKSQVSELQKNPQVAVQKQTDELIKRVGALMQLPSDETPTIANVTDASKAKEQSAFFNNAQNGDKVLMYVKAGEAILYRPSTNKIILVAPLTFTNNNQSGTTSSNSSTTGTSKATGTTTTNR